MPGPTDVLDIARSSFEDAHRNLDCDLAAAAKPVDARAVQDNHDAALANYLLALRTAFSCADALWEDALVKAQQAQAAVEHARAVGSALPRVIAAITSATGAVTNLINAAH